MRTSPERSVDLLRQGDLLVKGRMPWSSNATFLVAIEPDDGCESTSDPDEGRSGAGVGPDLVDDENHGEENDGEPEHEGDEDDEHGDDVSLDELDGLILAVYKPARGEQPLWDFPSGIYKREVAAWHLSEALGWDIVPPTVVRDGPLGEGSVQLFVKADFRHHYFTLVDDEKHHPALKTICAFDLLANSADRKSGHCLLGPDDRIWAVDNGLTFHDELKLRTVIWDFAGEELAPELVDDISSLVDDGLPDALSELLSATERESLLWRARSLLRSPRFPTDHTGRRHPWPLV